MPLDAQISRKALEAKRKRVQRELAQSQRILKSTSNKKKATLHQLSTLKRVIKQRKELIISLEKEIIATEEEIVRQREQLILLQKELNKVKEQLNETVKKAYKSRKTSVQGENYMLERKIQASREEVESKECVKTILDKAATLKPCWISTVSNTEGIFKTSSFQKVCEQADEPILIMPYQEISGSGGVGY